MAAKGSIAKEQVVASILQHFEGAFKYDKEIRIPVMENGEIVQIKVTLTCAKTNVQAEESSAFSAATPNASVNLAAAFPAPAAAPKEKAYEPTAEEKQNLSKLLENLGITVGV